MNLRNQTAKHVEKASGVTLSVRNRKTPVKNVKQVPTRLQSEHLHCPTAMHVHQAKLLQRQEIQKQTIASHANPIHLLMFLAPLPVRNVAIMVLRQRAPRFVKIAMQVSTCPSRCVNSAPQVIFKIRGVELNVSIPVIAQKEKYRTS